MNDLDSRHLEVAEGVPAVRYGLQPTRVDATAFVPRTKTASAS